MSGRAIRVEVLGAVLVRVGERVVTGNALGGRRGRLALVALALSAHPIGADRLAALIWGQDPPPTWPVALRGVVGSVRSALAALGAGRQDVIATVPGGYVLAAGVRVDVVEARTLVREAERLIAAQRFPSALSAAEAALDVEGAALLPAEDLSWLAEHRQALDELRLRALEVVAEAAGGAGEWSRAVAAAQQAVGVAGLDERLHRLLIHTLERSGDRAGAIGAYERCRELLAEELGVDPSAETVAVYLRTIGAPTGAPATARPPVEQSSFHGRGRERQDLTALLDQPGPVSLTGSGGVGKSRLAQRVLPALDGFAERLWVPLVAVVDDELVASSVALALGLGIGTEGPAAAVAGSLAPIGRGLLVLDGCEQVIDGVASLVAHLVGACPRLTVLVTSRVPLGLPAERTLDVGPLPTPRSAGPRALAASEPVRLLLARVRENGGDLVLDEDTAPMVAALCRRCAGLPLALELVAAQLADIAVGDLVDHLADITADQDRLQAVISHSHALLDEAEAAVFRRFAVLDGPVDLPLIRQVVAGPGVAPVRVVRLLRELMARKLLNVDTGGVHWRYHQDDEMHRFAARLLDEAGETRITYARLAQAIRTLLPDDARAAPTPYAQRVTAVLAAIRSLLAAAATGRADPDDGLEIAFRLHRYWASTDVAEGRFWLSRLLADAQPSAWTPLATFAAGYLSYWCGDDHAALDELKAAATMLGERPDPYRARALIYLGGLSDDRDQGDEAVAHVRQAIDAAAPFETDLQVSAAMGMGCVLAERADPSAAAYAAEAIALCRENGSAEQLAAAMPTAAMVCWQAGDFDAARGYVAEALPMHTGSRRIARVVLLSAAAAVALVDEDLDAALDHARTADDEATDLGIERELPLIRSIRSRALLAGGDIVGAAEHAISAVRAAQALTFDFPLATCLETAALVVIAAGRATPTDTGGLLASAARLRRRGDRPVPPGLRPAVDLARAAYPPDGGGEGADRASVVERALSDLSAVVAGHGPHLPLTNRGNGTGRGRTEPGSS